MGFKKQYPDKIVLFRMGDFFETFGDDAKKTAKILNITLTARDKSKDSIALAGFPHHALNQYLPKLIQAGQCVVIVDQIEDPKVAKGIVKRAVTRVVTPATIDGNIASEIKNVYLMSIYTLKKELAVALLDITTGEFKYTVVQNTQQNLESIIVSNQPSEVIVVSGAKDIVVGEIPIQIVPKSFQNIKYCEEIVKKRFATSTLESLGIDSDVATVSIAMILEYVSETQKMEPAHLQSPKRFNMNNSMVLDRSTVRNLEVVYNAYNQTPTDSLLSVIDNTQTLMGKRLLFSWILSPLLSKESIDQRLNIVEVFFKNNELLNSVRNILDGINDIERIVGKIGLGRVNGRDMKALQISLEKVLELNSGLKDIKQIEFVSPKDLEKIKSIIDLIEQSISESPPTTIMEGGIIKSGYDKEVDEIREISGNSKGWLEDFEKSERERTGITSLKISYNRVFGYYIDVTKTHQSKVPSDYIRKQTLVNSERYITEALKEKEEIILNAQGKLSTLEYNIFTKIRDSILEYIPLLQDISYQIAKVDVLSGFAFLAKMKGYCKPIVHDFGESNGILKIVNGRHPIIESISGESFISNDTSLNLKNERMIILTGPNMSGKSTYIRQVATISLLAQIGCFVPADSCEISMVDRIFTRVGASDDLSKGRSTFMVEMDEAANIINNATKYSLVILHI